jgi:hypothetical protein
VHAVGKYSTLYPHPFVLILVGRQGLAPFTWAGLDLGSSCLCLPVAGTLGCLFDRSLLGPSGFEVTTWF